MVPASTASHCNGKYVGWRRETVWNCDAGYSPLERRGGTAALRRSPHANAASRLGAAAGTSQTERQECQVYGESVSLSGKEWHLLQLLWESAGTLVDYETIKREIWPERLPSEEQGSVDVGTDELNVLIYRLRKKLGDASYF